MPSIRYIFRLIVAFLSRFKVIIIIGVGLGILIFLILNFFIPRFGNWQTSKIGFSGRYTSNTLPINIEKMIGDGLTKTDDSGNVQPGLAETWQSPDKGKTWVFKLKPGIKWQDGKTLVSRDISYKFSDATVSYPDNQTVVFTLQSPYSAFPSVVSQPIFRSGLLGTGDFKVVKLNLYGDFIDQITLENNKNMPDEAGIRYIYKFYPTEERLKTAFELGEVDEISGLMDASPLSSWPNIKIKTSTDKGEYVAVFFNTTDSVLADKTLRQALSYAINKDVLGGARAIGPISETSWAYNPQVKPYNYDFAKAKSMIDNMSDDQKSKLKITLTSSPILLPQAILIQKDWQAIGVDTSLQVISSVPTNYQALLAIFDSPDDPDQYTLWHSTQTQTNITHYTNPRIDKLLEDGRTTIDLNDRKQIYVDFQRFLVEDSPAAFLYYPNLFTISRH